MAEIENSKKQTFTNLARRLGKLPNDKKIVSLEMSAALAGVSLRVSREFVEAVPKAAKILTAEDLQNWAEMGRRLAMGNADLGAKFFTDGVEGLKSVPENARHLVFQICTRQLVLSSSIALETFELIPKLAKEIKDDELLSDFLKLASEIANRSAKHSSDFLQKSPQVCEALKRFDTEDEATGAQAARLPNESAHVDAVHQPARGPERHDRHRRRKRQSPRHQSHAKPHRERAADRRRVRGRQLGLDERGG